MHDWTPKGLETGDIFFIFVVMAVGVLYFWHSKKYE